MIIEQQSGLQTSSEGGSEMEGGMEEFEDKFDWIFLNEPFGVQIVWERKSEQGWLWTSSCFENDAWLGRKFFCGLDRNILVFGLDVYVKLLLL